ncbi:MAG: hypothetical protein H0T62_01015 [Parachlamydiaceae bacterium]|nr:hypothetical protein [Parachlamydiaceae bacterium]
MLSTSISSLPPHFTGINPDTNLMKLQLEPSHMFDASTVLAKIPPHERADIVDQVLTLKGIQVKNDLGEFLSPLALLAGCFCHF